MLLIWIVPRSGVGIGGLVGLGWAGGVLAAGSVGREVWQANRAISMTKIQRDLLISFVMGILALFWVELHDRRGNIGQVSEVFGEAAAQFF